MYHNLLVLVAFHISLKIAHLSITLQIFLLVHLWTNTVHVFDFTLAVVCIQVASLLLCTA